MKKNRVSPEGEIIAHPSRGTLMGNRGCLHNDSGEVIRCSARDAWVTCLTSFKGRRRPLMQPGHYTELFFLDEATALAAGHRPCAECRRARYVEFLVAWQHACKLSKRPTAREIDAQLKRERDLNARPEIRALNSLPNGAIVKDVGSGRFYAIFEQLAFLWTFDGYGHGATFPDLEGPFVVLTPTSSLLALMNGYTAEIHPSLTI